jgi:hypothetical protein
MSKDAWQRHVDKPEAGALAAVSARAGCEERFRSLTPNDQQIGVSYKLERYIRSTQGKVTL